MVVMMITLPVLFGVFAFGFGVAEAFQDAASSAGLLRIRSTATTTTTTGGKKLRSSSERWFGFEDLVFMDQHSLYGIIHPSIPSNGNLHSAIHTESPLRLRDDGATTTTTTTTTTTSTPSIHSTSIGTSTDTGTGGTTTNLLAALSKQDGDDTIIDPQTAELESEVLLDVSHLFLDFSVFVTKSKPVLNQAQIVGRLLLLLQDYIPDRHVSPEELGIQILMIGVCIARQE